MTSDEWNRDHPKGTPVRVWPYGRGGHAPWHIDTVTSGPARRWGGEAAVHVVGWRVLVPLAHVTPRAADPLPGYASPARNRPRIAP